MLSLTTSPVLLQESKHEPCQLTQIQSHCHRHATQLINPMGLLYYALKKPQPCFFLLILFQVMDSCRATSQNCKIVVLVVGCNLTFSYEILCVRDEKAVVVRRLGCPSPRTSRCRVQYPQTKMCGLSLPNKIPHRLEILLFCQGLLASTKGHQCMHQLLSEGNALKIGRLDIYLTLSSII